MIIFLSGCLVSCKQNVSEERIRVVDSSWIDSIDTSDAFFTVSWYAPYNIILLDSISDIYFHRVPRSPNFEGVGPHFYNLRPRNFEKTDDLIQIKEIVLAHMLLERSRRWIYLIYNQDTIRDRRYFILKDFFKNHDILVSTRRPTEEENAILNAIMSGQKYKPHLIEWKNTTNVPDTAWFLQELYWLNQQ